MDTPLRNLNTFLAQLLHHLRPDLSRYFVVDMLSNDPAPSAQYELGTLLLEDAAPYLAHPEISKLCGQLRQLLTPYSQTTGTHTAF